GDGGRGGRLGHGRVPATARGVLDTEDVVQVAIMRTLERLDRIDSSLRGSLLAYLRSAVVNLIRDEIRRARRRPRIGELNDEVPGRDRDPVDEGISRGERER